MCSCEKAFALASRYILNNYLIDIREERPCPTTRPVDGRDYARWPTSRQRCVYFWLFGCLWNYQRKPFSISDCLSCEAILLILPHRSGKLFLCMQNTQITGCVRVVSFFFKPQGARQSQKLGTILRAFPGMLSFFFMSTESCNFGLTDT